MASERVMHSPSLEDVLLWKEEKSKSSSPAMKRSLSFDESPVSIDAIFNDPMIPSKSVDGESGWLVSVGEEDDLEVMPELESAPVAPAITTPSPKAQAWQRVLELETKIRETGYLESLADVNKAEEEVAVALPQLEAERDFHREAQRLREMENKMRRRGVTGLTPGGSTEGGADWHGERVRELDEAIEIARSSMAAMHDLKVEAVSRALLQLSTKAPTPVAVA